jgi:hypothetical protein
MKRRPPTKTKAVLHAHARKRAAERLGLILNKAQRLEILHEIQAQGPHVRFLGRSESHPGNRTVWAVAIGELKCRVVYDKRRHALVTFLPEKSNDGER